MDYQISFTARYLAVTVNPDEAVVLIIYCFHLRFNLEAAVSER